MGRFNWRRRLHSLESDWRGRSGLRQFSEPCGGAGDERHADAVGAGADGLPRADVNTAYQRATADMRAAGINPMLAVNQGGASTPGGAMAQLQAPEFKNAAPDFSGVASSAMQVASGLTGLDKTRADTDVAKSAAKLNDAATLKAGQETVTSAAAAAKLAADTAKVAGVDTDKARAEAGAAAASAGLSNAQAVNAGIQSNVLRANVTSAEQEAKRKTMATEDYRRSGGGVVGDSMTDLHRIVDSLGESIDAAGTSASQYIRNQWNRWMK